MKRLTWIILGIVSLILSIIINYYRSLKELVILSLLFGLIIFGILMLLMKLFQNIKEKNIGKSILLIMYLFGAISFTFLIYVAIDICTLDPVSYFGTNIFKGQCEVYTISGCSSRLWYYESVCPSDDRISALRKYCTSLCKNSEEKSEYRKYYSINYRHPSVRNSFEEKSFFNSSCKSLVDCGNIQC